MWSIFFKDDQIFFYGSHFAYDTILNDAEKNQGFLVSFASV